MLKLIQAKIMLKIIIRLQIEIVLTSSVEHILSENIEQGAYLSIVEMTVNQYQYQNQPRHLQPLTFKISMFQYLARLNHQKALFQPQSSPYPPFQPNMIPSDQLHQWLSWEYMRWQPNFINSVQKHVPTVKLEQSSPIVHLSAQNYQIEPVKQQYRQKQTKEVQSLKADQEDIKINVQKKAMFLARKINLSQEEKQDLRSYRQLRVEEYLSKKDKRTFQKKIVYTTRKRVADKRIRYKGRFINQSKAKQLLGLLGTEHSFQELKAMMKLLKKHK